MPRIEAFEKYSDEYDEWFERNTALYKAELEAIRRLVPSPGAEGLEVGVGSGKFAAPLGIGVGVEPSETMAMKARRLGIDVYRGVAENLPFSDGRFDFALMVTTICFVDDLLISFREAFRVLKDTGFVVVGFVDRDSELGMQYSAKKERSKFYKSATFHSVPQVLDVLDRAGFSDTDILQTLVPGEPPDTILQGSGRGAFVVIRGMKS